MLTGMVFDIQRFAIHDGPGIRTTVFLKGCSNRCGWCHNPESLKLGPQLQYYPDRCVHCGSCVPVCPTGAHRMGETGHIFERELCTDCGACVAACNVQALMMAGKTMTLDEVMEVVLADAPYYKNSGGGITVSGGEPVLQADFTAGLLKMSKENQIHTCIETAGNYGPGLLSKVVPNLDLVLFDLKAWSPEIYEKEICARREVILNTLSALDETGIPLIVRTPVIGGVNDSAGEITAIASYLQRIRHLKQYQLIPYHALGKVKYDALGEAYEKPYSTPPKEQMERLEQLALEYVPVYNMQSGLMPKRG